MKNVLLVVDTRNLNFCLSRTFGKDNAKLDYNKYIETAIGQDILFKAMAYGIHNAQDTYKFISFLKGCGFSTSFKEVIKKGDNIKYVGYSVALTIDVTQMLSTQKVDKVILGATDLEYIDLINYVKSKGVICEVYACAIPRLIRDVADKCTEIDKDLLYKETAIEVG